MSVKVIELMELTKPGFQQTKLAIEWIKEAFSEMKLDTQVEISEQKISIVSGTKYYSLPTDMIAIKRVLYLIDDGVLEGSYAPLGKVTNKGEVNESAV